MAEEKEQQRIVKLTGRPVRVGEKSGFHFNGHRADPGDQPTPNASRSQIPSQSGSDGERDEVGVNTKLVPRAQKFHKNRK